MSFFSSSDAFDTRVPVALAVNEIFDKRDQVIEKVNASNSISELTAFLDEVTIVREELEELFQNRETPNGNRAISRRNDLIIKNRRAIMDIEMAVTLRIQVLSSNQTSNPEQSINLPSSGSSQTDENKSLIPLALLGGLILLG